MCCWKNDKNNVCPFEDSGGWAEGGRVERKAGGGGESSLGRQSKDSRAKKKKNGKTRRTEEKKIFFSHFTRRSSSFSPWACWLSFESRTRQGQNRLIIS